MVQPGFNAGVLRFCAWCGVGFCLMWLLGAGPITGWVYLPPPSAANSAAQTTAYYTSSLFGVRVGCTLMNFSSAFYTVWGMVVALMIKRTEGEFPILFYVQVVSLTAAVIVILFLAFFWGTGAFRAGDTLPQITQLMNDLGWLGVLYTGAPFSVFQIALGTAILNDRSTQPIYPRWSAYLSFFGAFFYLEAAAVLFFKTGPFSQNGFFVFYIPVIAFFVWILVFTRLALRAIGREAAARAGGASHPLAV